ncbi:hypothetical protein GYH30_013905 [Glycine max]|nr:hypothetical protein GYH30_013905 [Glycine max]
MGVGLFVSIFAMASAALVEKKRRDHNNSFNKVILFDAQYNNNYHPYLSDKCE